MSGALPPQAKSAEPSTATIKQEIAQTRDALAQTISALEAKINPAELREKIEAELAKVGERATALVHQQLGEAKTLLREELDELEGKARQGLSDAATSVKNGLIEVKDSIKEDLRSAFTDAKQSLRAATVGRVETLVTTIGETMNETKATLIETVRANPIPTALIGAGLIWMLVSRSKASTRRGGKHTGERFAAEAEGILERGEHMAAEVAGRAGKAASSALHSASEAVGSAVHGIEDATERSGGAIKSFAKGAGDTAARVAKGAGNMYDQAADGVRRGAERIGKSYGSGLKEHPLLLVGAALALGAVFGFVLPRTQRENSLMGPSRDRLLAGAKSGVQEAAGSLAGGAEVIIDGARDGAPGGNHHQPS